MVGPGGFEPPTSPLSGARSSQLSYEPSGRVVADRGDGPPAAVLGSGTVRARAEWECADDWPTSLGMRSRVVPRKEVIQPQVPLRLPCYDLVPVTRLTVGASLPCGLGQRLRVLPASVT